MFDDADLIHSYSRADALRDGALIDVTPTAREAGIRWPVALTQAAWGRCVRVPPGVACQDEAGRLWDVLWLLRCAVAPHGGGCDRDPDDGLPTDHSGLRRDDRRRHGGPPSGGLGAGRRPGGIAGLPDTPRREREGEGLPRRSPTRRRPRQDPPAWGGRAGLQG